MQSPVRNKQLKGAASVVDGEQGERVDVVDVVEKDAVRKDGDMAGEGNADAQLIAANYIKRRVVLVGE